MTRTVQITKLVMTISAKIPAHTRMIHVGRMQNVRHQTIELSADVLLDGQANHMNLASNVGYVEIPCKVSAFNFSILFRR